MTDPAAFLVGSLLLLFMPGPTNALLFVSAAAAGLRRSLLLPLAELAGYLTAIALLMVGLGPLVRGFPAIASALKLGSAAYLVVLALLLWARSGDMEAANAPIGARRVYIATVLNPKALVFAFAIVPYTFDRDWTKAIPWLACLSFLIVLAGACWIAAGALLGLSAAGRKWTSALHRLGVVVLLAFAVTLVISVFR